LRFSKEKTKNLLHVEGMVKNHPTRATTALLLHEKLLMVWSSFSIHDERGRLWKD
jgi:hypothetical protein